MAAIWEVLEDENKRKEFNYLWTITYRANCASWGLGDPTFCEYDQSECAPGNLVFREKYKDLDKRQSDFHDNMLYTGAQFLGKGTEFPTVPDGYYLAAMYVSLDGYHFIRRHRDGAWTHRPDSMKDVEQLGTKPKNLASLSMLSFSAADYFVGWYAIPNAGTYNDVAAIAYRNRDKFIATHGKGWIRGLDAFCKAYEQKRKIRENFVSFPQFESDCFKIGDDLAKVPCAPEFIQELKKLVMNSK